MKQVAVRNAIEMEQILQLWIVELSRQSFQNPFAALEALAAGLAIILLNLKKPFQFIPAMRHLWIGIGAEIQLQMPDSFFLFQSLCKRVLKHLVSQAIRNSDDHVFHLALFYPK